MGRYVHVIFVIWSLIRLCGNENDNDIVRVSCLRFDQVLVWKGVRRAFEFQATIAINDFTRSR